jgi:copper chaperone CopZ
VKEEPHHADSSLSETMNARIEVDGLGHVARESEIIDAVAAIDGVTEAKVEKGALHVAYDPLATTEKKIELVIRSTGNAVKSAAIDKEAVHPDLPTPSIDQTSRAKIIL